jgi:hypothetical protein
MESLDVRENLIRIILFLLRANSVKTLIPQESIEPVNFAHFDSAVLKPRCKVADENLIVAKVGRITPNELPAKVTLLAKFVILESACFLWHKTFARRNVTLYYVMWERETQWWPDLQQDLREWLNVDFIGQQCCITKEGTDNSRYYESSF